MELVSIIMAAFNAQKTIGKAIESVIQQSYQNWELIVINDCSSDDTPEIVERYSAYRDYENIRKHQNNLAVTEF